MSKVLIMRGQSGSGKSTYVSNYIKDKPEKDVVVCSADHFHMVDGKYKFDITKASEAHRMCFVKFIDAVQRDVPFIVVDNTNTELHEIAPYLMYARANLVEEIEIVRLNCSPATSHERNVHEVPLKAVKAQYNRIAPLPWHWPKETILNTMGEI